MIKRILFFLFFISISRIGYSSEVLYINGKISDNYYITGRYLEVLEDSSSKLTLEEVMTGKTKSFSAQGTLEQVATSLAQKLFDFFQSNQYPELEEQSEEKAVKRLLPLMW